MPVNNIFIGLCCFRDFINCLECDLGLGGLLFLMLES